MKKSFAIAFLLLSAIFLIQCNIGGKEKRVFDENTIYCDAETLSENGKFFLTNKSGVTVTGGDKLSKEAYFSGKSSIKLSKDSTTGFGVSLKNLLPNELIEVQVQRKSKDGKGGVAVQDSETGFNVEQFSSLAEKDENGWDFLILKFRLPKEAQKMKELKLFLWHQDSEAPVYFDDLVIIRHKSEPLKSFGNTSGISIQISSADYDSIRVSRDRAIAQKQITKNLKNKYPGILNYKGKSYIIEIRLKGDWADHLLGNKWSYRISIKNGEAFLGMKSFSIQDPKTRGFMHEWVLHKLFKKEDVLTTRFHFLPVSVNGAHSGVYAIEEHFEKQLIESNNRREGVIVKLDEEGLWEQRAYSNYNETHDKSGDLAYEAAEIKPFKEKKTRKKEALSKQFLIAQNLLNKYKVGAPNVSEYLDVDKLAKAYAILNIGNIDHSFIWHNQRFYYNPVLSKLEFIAFDCYPSLEYASRRYPLITGMHGKKGKQINPETFCFLNPLNDEVFQQKYLKYLKKYTAERFIENFIKERQLEIDSLTELIASDYLVFDYNKGFLPQNRDKIKSQIEAFENKIINNELSFKREEVNFLTRCEPHFPLKSISLSVNVESKKTKNKQLSLKNYHCQTIAVVGYSLKENKDSLIRLTRKIKVERFNKTSKNKFLEVPRDVKKLYYRVDGLEVDTLFTSKINPWPRVRSDFRNKSLSLQKESKYYPIEGKIVFNKGKHVINKSVIIPEGVDVVFEPGAELILNKEHFFLSYSSVTMKGTEQEPIKITSTDGTAKGFTVLQAENKSKLSHVVFNGLNTFSINNWQLTGAVTFYESDVEINNCVFTKNHCEDGLNIIRSEFLLKDSEISKTLSDGFDADFCTGEVVNTSFKNTGNDCIDFSGSTVLIKDCNINTSGDKGISCGEQSTVEIENVKIDGAVLGVASKDNSEVTINNITLKNCEVGFAAFQKKPEYGTANIAISRYEIENVVLLKEVGGGSEIILN